MDLPVARLVRVTVGVEVERRTSVRLLVISLPGWWWLEVGVVLTAMRSDRGLEEMEVVSWVYP